MIVGIDLGTTNSLIGWVSGGEATLFGDERGSKLLPSVVALDEGGRVLTGRRARNRRLLDPSRAIQQVKRRMGSSEKLSLGAQQLSPQEVSALLLRALLDWVESSGLARPEAAIITVPAYFEDHQRQATRDAGELAGLRVERLVNEPTAAALTQTTGAEERVLIYDFGGGTFDVSVLERDEGFLEVASSHGDTQLGGADIDKALVGYALEQLGKRAEVVRADPAAMARLEAALERAKIALSDRQEVALLEAQLAGDAKDPVHLELVLTQEALERLAAPFVERTLTSVDRALELAGWTVSSLDRIVLVGGASRMPLVKARLEDHLDRPVHLSEDADHAVALGASILAGRMAGEAIDEVLVDITPHTLAAGSLDRFDELIAVPLIARGTVVPASKRSIFFTQRKDQSAVEIPVVQGEAHLAEDNTELGEVRVDHLPPSPERSEIEVEFQLDLSGMLHARAKHVLSGREASVEIRRGPSALTRTERRKAAARIDALTAGDPSGAQGPGEDDRRLADALLSRARFVLGERSEPTEERAALEVAVAAVEAALADGSAISERLDDLSGALLDLV